jgi:hypothetical protein
VTREQVRRTPHKVTAMNVEHYGVLLRKTWVSLWRKKYRELNNMALTAFRTQFLLSRSCSVNTQQVFALLQAVCEWYTITFILLGWILKF